MQQLLLKAKRAKVMQLNESFLQHYIYIRTINTEWLEIIAALYDKYATVINSTCSLSSQSRYRRDSHSK